MLDELDAFRWRGAPLTDGLIRALRRFDASGGVDAAPASWWSAFDERARAAHGWFRSASGALVLSTPTARLSAWQRLLPFAPRPSEPAGLSVPADLPPFWAWALAVCAADGRVREAALRPERLPLGHRGLLPLLAVRCADWAPAVRTAARAAFGAIVAGAGPEELAWATVSAWSCDRRERGAEAVRVVTDRLADAPASVWRTLLGDQEIPVRRRALAEAVALGRDQSAVLLDLALSRQDVVVAERAAQRLLRRLVPPGRDASASPEADAAFERLLGAPHPAVRATTVTALRRACRVELAEPFVADPSASVREVARWVLRSRGAEPAAVCRARAAGARRPEQITAGLVLGLAECGDRTDEPWLRAQLDHPRAKVRSAALRVLGRMQPPGVTREELCAVLDRTVLDEDVASGVLRAVGQLLEPEAGGIPVRRADAWLAPDRPARLRRLAARLLRGRGPWGRLESDLRLLHDQDGVLAAAARQDARTWAMSAQSTTTLPTREQHEALTELLAVAGDALDEECVVRLRFALAHARPRAAAGPGR